MFSAIFGRLINLQHETLESNTGVVAADTVESSFQPHEAPQASHVLHQLRSTRLLH
jgi:hypothetical protein